jgi:hypothetical protein
MQIEKEFNRAGVFPGNAPKGILIADTYNVPGYPLKDTQFELDDAKSSIYNIQLEYKKIYGLTDEFLFLPWHYTVEIIRNKYVVYSTRPFLYSSLIPGYEDHLVICILGNSNKDLYTPHIYKLIAHQIINPLRVLPAFKTIRDPKNTKFLTGQNFKQDLILSKIKN